MSGSPRPSSPGAPRAPPEAAMNVTYAFDDAHKESFRALATSMSFVGACTMLFGGLACVFCAGAFYAGFIPSAIGTAVAAALCLVTGWWMTSAGRSLSALVGTRGRDLDHLMETVAQLRRLFGLARVVIVLVALVAVAGGGLIVWCTLITERGGRCFGLWG
ncbi:MAG: hypothetical protein M3O46_08115 [Myxococcota bacterium]|nr:hypothetical protein [Myxococcota bacterium]